MIGFIGGGNMAEALIKGMTAQGIRDIIVSEPMEDRRRRLEQAYGIKTTHVNKPVASSANIVILAIKPQNMADVLDEIADVITDDKTIVSIAAGITLSYLQSRLKTKKLIRVMPNTPALVQEGMSVMALCECFSDRDVATVREILLSVGKVIVLPEKYMDAVTALSGSGPAFVALFVEGMIEAGIKMSLDRDHASELAVQTLIGTAKLLETGMSPQRLREMVTSPGGTTAAGLKSFADNAFVGIIVEALQSARKRAEELGRRD
ncbi:MAG TPA: pyrroline-5-carboxylate reductase [Thermodesulfovibrionales bacterium]|jgi:pyrroline-5-carboxylate reductase|nr:pyrroline-5-carboxylate reductase [Thermodesulfovibrionales bacterium]